MPSTALGRVRRALTPWGVLLALLLALATACGGESTAPSPSTTATAVGAPASPSAPPFPASASPAPATGTPSARRALGTPSGLESTAKDPTFEPLPGAKAFSGMLGKAAYKVEMPDQWNGELVLFAHGVQLTGNEVVASPPDEALRRAFISGGTAWAASSYSETRYVPGIGADDTMALLDQFTAQFGKPKRVYLYGVSMGGHVVALLMEHYPQQFDGALAVCGAIGGEEELDYITSWTMLGEFIGRVTLPIGQGPTAVATALIGLRSALGSPENPTTRGTQFASAVKQLTGGPRPFFKEGFREQFTLNFGLLVLDPNRKWLAIAAATNADARYDIEPGLGLTADELNAGVRRLPADPALRNAEAHPDAVPTTGRISRPLLTLHDTGDLFVPITNEVDYRRKADAAGAGGLLVQRAIREAGHCKFSPAELTTAWADLLAWVHDGKKPAGDDLTGDLSDIGRQFTSPIRPGDPGNR